MNTSRRLRALTEAKLIHPRHDAVTAALFNGELPFFLPQDKVQVKYEMLRAHVVDGLNATQAAQIHGYSRAAFYLIVAAFEAQGMAGLVDGRRGRRGPLKLTPEIIEFIGGASAEVSSVQIAEQIERQFAVRVHRRTVERARR